MGSRARWIALAALALLAAIAAWLAVESSSDGAREASGGDSHELAAARVSGVDASAETRAAVASSASDARGAASSKRPMPSLELVAIHGRLVLANGGAPRNGVVWLRTGDDEIDYRDVVEKLGGSAAVARANRAFRFELEVFQLGGWTPSFETKARDDGTFELHIPKSLPRFTLAARAEGAVYDGAEMLALTPKVLAEPIVLVLQEAGAVEGRVTDSAGRAVAGAVVGLEIGSRFRYGSLWLSEHRLTTADDDGRFAFAAVSRGSHSVAVRTEEHAPLSRHPVEVRPPATTHVDLSLAPGHSISGVVVDAAGAPLAGVDLLAARSAPSSWTPWYGAGRTDAQGRFRIGGLLADVHVLRVFRDGLVPRLAATESLSIDVPRPTGAPPLRIVLGEGSHLAGRVIDGAGRGLADVTVSATTAASDPGDSEKRGVVSTQAASTDGDGRFRL
ncbi:MAG TPA: carboxypeptidase-like regulatory domain-containing protein, partial [Planctomycetota bacterium]|nr:carboxypeptidase-like regulatory domain-containing protein [Planctomycetota bacterium]